MSDRKIGEIIAHPKNGQRWLFAGFYDGHEHWCEIFTDMHGEVLGDMECVNFIGFTEAGDIWELPHHEDETVEPHHTRH